MGRTKTLKKERHVFRKLLIAGAIIFLLIVAAALIILFPVLHVDEFQALDAAKLAIDNSSVTVLYDADNREIESFKSPSVPFAQIPKYTLDAFIASEDRKFYSHNGIDFKRLAGAAWEDIKSGKAKEGGSTISQQVVKNTHLTNEKTVRRKLEEMKLAKELEDKYSKESILEIYLNRIYFGGNNYGIESAAQNYFGKPASALTLSESAMLAGIIPSPNNYSPAVSYEKAVSRRDLILKIMRENGFITEDEYGAAKAETVTIKQEKRTLFTPNNYLNSALNEAAGLTGVSVREFGEKHYKIYTFMDREKQAALEETIAAQSLPKNSHGNAPDILGALIDNNTGGVCAFYGVSKNDLRTLKRPPASAIKPILVYAPALDNNTVSADSEITDEETDFGGYKPKNYNDKYLGRTTVRKAVEQSSNIAAVKVLDYEGIAYAKSVAAKAGIEFDAGDDTLALALGGFTYGITPLSLCNGYAMLAAGGVYRKAAFVKSVYGPSGNLVYSYDGHKERAVGEDTAYIMTDILKGTVRNGTAKKLAPLGYDIAAKTGTAGNETANTDAYCVSYTSRHTMAVWLGNSSGSPEYALIKSVTGGGLPAAISKSVYGTIYKDAAPPAFNRPGSVVTVDGKLYAARFAPAPEQMPESPAPALKTAEDDNGGAARKRTAEKERHEKEYERLKKESEEKKEGFFKKFWDKFKKLA